MKAAASLKNLVRTEELGLPFDRPICVSLSKVSVSLSPEAFLGLAVFPITHVRDSLCSLLAQNGIILSCRVFESAMKFRPPSEQLHWVDFEEFETRVQCIFTFLVLCVESIVGRGVGGVHADSGTWECVYAVLPILHGPRGRCAPWCFVQ